MKLTLIPALIGLGAALLSCQAPAQSKSDADKLHELVQEARAQVKVLRDAAGVRGEAREGGESHEGREGREGRGEHGGERRREGRGEHGGERRREGRGEHGGERREGRGEHGGEGEEGGEEGGQQIAKNEKWDNTRNGAQHGSRLRRPRASPSRAWSPMPARTP